MKSNLLAETVRSRYELNIVLQPFSTVYQCAVRFICGWVFIMAILPLRAGNFYAGTSPVNVPWTNGLVPYEFTNTLTAAERQTYLDGLREWELAANVKFVPHTGEARYVLFTYDPAGFDNVSVGYSPQVVSVNSLSRAQVCHEMGHSFGFTHENIRTDQTNYLTVLTNNIADPADNLHWFIIDSTSVTNGPYDFESVMHLVNNFSSVDPDNLYTQQARPAYAKFQPRMGNLCLSAGDRAALSYLYGPPLVPLTNIVTTTADAGPGSLRAAIYYAMDHPGATIRFNIPTTDAGYSNGVFTIQLTGYLPPLVTDGTVIDGSTQPGFSNRPLIFVDGSQMLPEAYSPGTVTGLLIFAANCQLKNLSFQNFNWNGLTLIYPYATNNLIAGCWLGLDYTGTNAAPNALQGILIYQGASGNVLGGTNASVRNVISGNTQYGVFITGTNSVNNTVLGNYIGTDASGNLAVSNGIGGVILIGGTGGNTIGGTNSAARNIISGNVNAGLWIIGSGSTGNTVAGNYFGLNASGLAALPNSFVGMYLVGGAQNNLITGNVLSGNVSEGLRLSDVGTMGNVIQGNLIGTDSTGLNPLPNGYAGLTIFAGATANMVGGTSPVARNVLSGNAAYGLVIGDTNTSGNLVQGNFIGTDQTGTNGLGNGYANVELQNGATGNAIGGVAAGAGNVIAFSGGTGVALYDSGTVHNSIRGNSIFNNFYLGIDLNNDGVTPNHTGFIPGPNHLQNFPAITNAYGLGAATMVAGSLNSLPNQSFFIDVYRSFSPDSSGYGEGQFYVGSVTVITDGAGNGGFALTNTVANYTGQYFTATATSAAGDTSEFSLAVLATNQAVASASFTGPYLARTNGFTFTLTLQTNFSYRIQATTNLALHPVPWIDLASFSATSSPFTFTDGSATNYQQRFYRVISP